MTKVLVVDDNPTNRKLLVTLLTSEGHLTVEARDGCDGLAIARRERPDLVISDILMPTMDGYEFVRRLREDPSLAHTAVIFYTAHYHESEARALAERCGVQRVLVKPGSRRELLAAVEQALTRGAPAAQPVGADPEFDVQHLRLLTDKLSQKTAELRAVNARLSALTNLNMRLASEREPQELLQQVCTGARNLLGARYAVLAVENEGAEASLIVCHSGLKFANGSAPEVSLSRGVLGRVCSERRARRVNSNGGGTVDIGLPAAYPAGSAALAVPVTSLTRAYGWVCLVDKVGAAAFTQHDEQLLAILGAQVGRVYENGALYRDLQKHAAQLLREMEERERTNVQLRASEERVIKLNRLYAMLSGINSLIVRVSDRHQLLREACRLAVEQGRFKAAWCGLGRLPAKIAQAAAAGELPPAGNGAQGGAWDIGRHPLVAAAMQSRQPAVSNDLGGAEVADPLSEAMLAAGCRALAVLPFLMEGAAVGCLVLISSEPGTFDETEMVLLSEMGGDISFAFDYLDKAERLNYLAYYDALTGLANRIFLQERLAQHIRSLATQDQLFALIVVDIDDFDSLNDALGRSGGDELLRAFAARMVRGVGDAGFVARSGSDEFAAVIPRPGDVMDVTRTVEEWLGQWSSAPFDVAGQAQPLALKGGIALFPQDGTNAATLLHSAETALKNAKETRATYAFYTPQLGKALHERRTLESSLRRALDREELVLHYQPKVDLETRSLAGVEALMRWRHPERGIVFPATFIPVMEETGLIVEAGVWALRRASADRARWLEQSLPAPRVAVNVSSAQLRREDFVRTVASALTVTGPEAGIDIEVTESLLMKDVADNIEKLSRIRELGIGIALDDFGTGYSSLAYLARLPVETIKIDRSFVVAMLDDPSAMTLVSTVISLAHTLNLKTVAEGVESEEQAKILRLLRCDLMQGYLISKPLSFEDMTAYLSGARSCEAVTS